MNILKNLHHLLVNRGYDRLLKSPKWLEAHDRVRKPRAQPPEPWWLISSQPRHLCWLELESCPEAPGAELWGAQQSGGCHWESGTAWLSLGSYCSLFSGEKGGWGGLHKEAGLSAQTGFFTSSFYTSSSPKLQVLRVTES